MLTNFLRFIEKDSIHIEYYINNSITPSSDMTYTTIEVSNGDINFIKLTNPVEENIKNIDYRKFKSIIIHKFRIINNEEVSCMYEGTSRNLLLSLGRL